MISNCNTARLFCLVFLILPGRIHESKQVGKKYIILSKLPAIFDESTGKRRNLLFYGE
jgi:hypothetical protein